MVPQHRLLYCENGVVTTLSQYVLTSETIGTSAVMEADNAPFIRCRAKGLELLLPSVLIEASELKSRNSAQLLGEFKFGLSGFNTAKIKSPLLSLEIKIDD